MEKREKQMNEIIHLLMNEGEFITSEDIAEKLGVSAKTVYRLIKSINDDIESEPLIISEKGRGYKLNYISYNNWKRKAKELSPKRRRTKLMEKLLIESPNSSSFYDLMSEFYISESVLLQDIHEIGKIIKKYGLRLINRNSTLSIMGEEDGIRKAILSCIQQYSIIDIDELINSSNIDINPKDASFIISQLEEIEGMLNHPISYPYNINIFLHLYIFIQRYSTEEGDEKELKYTDERIYKIAKKIIKNISRYIGKPVSNREIENLYQYLISSRIDSGSGKIIEFSKEVEEITNCYLISMEQLIEFDVRADSIFVDLANHIKPMLKRLQNEINIKNGLLSQIQLVYMDIFEKVKMVSKMVSEQFKIPEISDDENGFITLYFAKLMELNKKKINTLIVCTTGIGTSELLRAKMENKFSDLNIVDVVAARDICGSFLIKNNIELIVSTIKLDLPKDYSFVLVSAMLTPDNQAKIRDEIEEIRKRR